MHVTSTHVIEQLVQRDHKKGKQFFNAALQLVNKVMNSSTKGNKHNLSTNRRLLFNEIGFESREKTEVAGTESASKIHNQILWHVKFTFQPRRFPPSVFPLLKKKRRKPL